MMDRRAASFQPFPLTFQGRPYGSKGGRLSALLKMPEVCVASPRPKTTHFFRHMSQPMQIKLLDRLASRLKTRTTRMVFLTPYLLVRHV